MPLKIVSAGQSFARSSSRVTTSPGFSRSGSSLGTADPTTWPANRLSGVHPREGPPPKVPKRITCLASVSGTSSLPATKRYYV